MDYKYLIVGGGMTADSAVDGIRESDSDGSIGMFTMEPEEPYNRPPLTKGLWHGESFDDIWRGTDAKGVELHLGRAVTSLDVESNSVTDDQGQTHTFGKLLLAMGGTPRRLPFGGDNVIYFRTVDDYRKVRALADDEGKRFAVIGSGFIGSEIAASLAGEGREVVMAFPEDGIGARVYPSGLSAHLNGYYEENGVTVLAKHSVTNIEERGDQLVVKAQPLDSADTTDVVVDAVIAGLGITPNVELAGEAGLAIDNGIVVDELMRTEHPDGYASGDVAAYYSPPMGARLRVEHEDSANALGKLAGQAMAGQGDASTQYPPYFWSDMFEMGYEAAGQADATLENYVDWKDENKEGVIYYLDGGKVRGVLLWNTRDKWEAASSLITEAATLTPDDLKGRI